MTPPGIPESRFLASLTSEVPLWVFHCRAVSAMPSLWRSLDLSPDEGKALFWALISGLGVEVAPYILCTLEFSLTLTSQSHYSSPLLIIG